MAHFPSIIGPCVIWNPIWFDVVARIGHDTFQNVAPPLPLFNPCTQQTYMYIYAYIIREQSF